MQGTVEAAKLDGKPCTIVPGYFHGPLRRKHLLLGSTVRGVIVPEIIEEREAWLKKIPTHIAPWKLLEESVGDFTRKLESTSAENFAKAIGGTIVDNSASISARSPRKTIDETEWVANLGYLPDRMGKSTLMDELNF